jgi:GT2 family glycosyltransferase
VTYIIVLNWNGWRDTIECLQSLLAMQATSFRVVVCDNNSSDDSLAHIGNWLQTLPSQNLLLPSKGQADCKTTHYQLLNMIDCPQPIPDAIHRISLIQTGENRGYGAGNNVGIRFALQDPDMRAVWVLNNDVTVAHDSLIQLERFGRLHPKLGPIGAKLLYYDNPSVIQAIGGRFNRYLATATHVGQGDGDVGQFDDDLLARSLDYPVGASLFASRDFLESVGLLSEDYFLFFEEMDWVMRARAQGWQMGFCWQCKVYHKEGSSSGAHTNARLKSWTADYYSLINRVVFTRKYFPKNIWSVKLGLLVAALNRLRRGQLNRLQIIAKALVL